MLSDSKSILRNRMLRTLAGLIASCALFISEPWAQTYVSGKVITADGMAVASGAVALEKGKLHNNAFLAGWNDFNP